MKTTNKATFAQIFNMQQQQSLDMENQVTGIENEAFTPEAGDLCDSNVAVHELDMNTNIVMGNSPIKDLMIKDPDPCVSVARRMSTLNLKKKKNSVPALSVRNACKSYKSNKGTSVILNDFNMTVKEGSIYSLLGSSGCGKTTLLSCCVGVKNLDQGQIRIFGHKPGSRRSGVPGPGVGYMPQEIALYPELTIQEVLLYFGRMFGMNKKTITESTNFLINFLALPPPHRRIGTLSGGQMRRVSFGVALVHSPRLLILDEPTVGVDPLLTRSIWNHLEKLVSAGDTTCIITTHHIAEAQRSNTIGLMRNGKLLAEDSPDNLLRIHNISLLEDLVLKLCLQNEMENDNSSTPSISPISSIEDVPNAVIISNKSSKKRSSSISKRSDQKSNFKPPQDGKNVSLFQRSSKNGGFSLSTDLENGENDDAKKNYLPETITYGDIASVELKGVSPNKDETIDDKGTKKKLETKLSVEFANVEETEIKELQEFHRKSASIRRQSSAVSLNNSFSTRYRESLSRVQAMTIKNGISLLRNIPFLLFIFFMPAIQVITVCISVGQDPKGLSFGLVNLDSEDPRNCSIVPGCITGDNYTGSLSCRFLEFLSEKGTLKLKTYDDEEDAIKDVERSTTWGYLLFHKNYTESMIERALFGVHTNVEAVYGSRIKFRLDQSNLQIFRETSKVFLESFNQFMRSVSEDCQVDPVIAEPPIFFAQPIFGMDSVNFTDFLAPSILLAILFFFPLCGGGIAYLTEKKMGTLSRSLVAGVSTSEMMGAYLIVQIVLLCIQVALSFLILEWVFHVRVAGPLHCAYLLGVMVGIAGMSMGFLVAEFCNDEFEAIILSIGGFFPNVLLSGLLWPLEGMPIYVQYFSYLLPCTWAGEAMRSVLTRGVGYTHSTVWPGFLSVSLWIVIYWSLNVAVQRFKAKK